MYSGVLLSNKSGAVFGTHQKINRVARQRLSLLADDTSFPPIRQIQYFEGKNGPDGIKSKSPGRDEPWHYYNPQGKKEDLLPQIESHFGELVAYLKQGNEERAAFEASWLSHALVDGMTPAHHYPYEEELRKLRAGEDLSTRTSLREKLVMKGDTRGEKILNNWKMWGAKGLFTTHYLFELGVASATAPLAYKAVKPTKQQLEMVRRLGVSRTFQSLALEVADRHLYDRFRTRGWTTRLAREVRSFLVPQMIIMVTLAWSEAVHQADSGKGKVK